MNIGFGIRQGSDGKYLVGMDIVDEHSGYSCVITDQVHYAEVIDQLIAGLKNIKNDMRQAASGLVVAQEVPNGFRREKGR
jgi:hypothetical protein